MGATDMQETAFGGVRTKKGMFRTVAQTYKEQLGRLMSTLRNTNPHFVRCIIPNHEKKVSTLERSTIHSEYVLCSPEKSTLCSFSTNSNATAYLKESASVVKVSQIVCLSKTFRHRYEILTPNLIPKGFMDGKEAVKRMVCWQ